MNRSNNHRDIRGVENVGFLRLLLVFSILAFFIFRSTLEYDRLQLDGARPLTLQPISFAFSGNTAGKQPRVSSYSPLVFENSEIQNAVQKEVENPVHRIKNDSKGDSNLAQKGFGQNPVLRMNKITTQWLAPVELKPADMKTSKALPADFKLNQTDNTKKVEFFIKPSFAYGLQSRFDLHEMADLKVFEPGTERNSFNAVQMEAFGKRMNRISQFGLNVGVKLKNNLSLSSGIEMLEFSGTQSFIYDIEQKVTGTITRFVPIGGPPGSAPEFLEIEEKRVDQHDIQDTVTAQFTYTALSVPLEIGYQKQLNSRFEVFASAQTALQVRARNEVNYESKNLPLQNEQTTTIYSGGAFVSVGLSAGVGYLLLPNLTLRAEPAFIQFHNLGSDQSNTLKNQSRFTSIRSSLVWKLN